MPATKTATTTATNSGTKTTDAKVKAPKDSKTKPASKAAKADPTPAQPSAQDSTDVASQKPTTKRMELTEANIQALKDRQNAVNKEQVSIKNDTLDMLAEGLRAKKRLASLDEKKRKRKENNSGNNAGIKQELEVSDALAKFMGLSAGAKVARTAALSAISKYASDNSLKGVEVYKEGNSGETKMDKRVIKPDDKLIALFPEIKASQKVLTKPITKALAEDKEDMEILRFTSIMKHLKQHFPAPAQKITDASTTSTPSDSKAEIPTKAVASASAGAGKKVKTAKA